MIPRLPLLILLPLLCACAPTLLRADASGGELSRGLGSGRGEAFAAANAHCQRYGKTARLTSQNGIVGTVTFACVAPGTFSPR